MTNENNIEYYEVETDPRVDEFVNNFIKKHLPEWYGHFIDTDENDAQLLRVQLSQLLTPSQVDGIRCHDCNVLVGDIHHKGCDVEECPFTGVQRISCSCGKCTGDLPWINRVPFGREKRANFSGQDSKDNYLKHHVETAPKTDSREEVIRQFMAQVGFNEDAVDRDGYYNIMVSVKEVEDFIDRVKQSKEIK